MTVMLGGLVAFVITAIVFWLCLPRGGKTLRLVDTEWEPYVGVAFCSAVALSFTMMLSGALEIGLFDQIAGQLRGLFPAETPGG